MSWFLKWMASNGSVFLLVSSGMLLLRWRYLTSCLRFAALFIGLAILGEIVSYITGHLLHVHNLYILHGYTIVEFLLIALFYRSFFNGFYPRWLVPALIAGFLLIAALSTIFLQQLSDSNAYVRGLESLLVIGLALLCFYKILTELLTKRLEKDPVFWINTGFLLYFAGNLFLFLLSNALLKQPHQQLSFMAWGLHALLMALMHVFIGIGLWFSPNLR
ncbi:hypothetical protein Q5H93_05930 [Hymenobacter sp. ASUV-10]|uniref:Uncharacterized protein n=1 Tax=Hymenobacter aranciens TaxID=3063996 RepID=A0ABT9B7K9_9BACT|nr:hypothetical protein [Hymenobacter sp. ASUV-10]MDO7874264.1 hypothetical protein [Hymenobacter sp. ASUV-10]